MRTIAHISDLHFGRLDAPVAEALVDDLRRQPPSLLVASGDFTQRARRRQYAQAAAYLKRLPGRQIVVPGNHDIPMYDVIRRFFYPLHRFRAYITQDLFPSYSDQEMYVLGINTARSFTQKSGWITEDQLAVVEQKMHEQPPSVMRILVTHHPFIPAPRDPHGDVVRRGGDALARLEQCGVDLLLAGHLHLAYHDDVRSRHTAIRRSILSIQAGTATSTRRRGEPNAYNWITISPDLVTVAVRAWKGRAFEESLVTRYTRSDHIWKRELQLPVDEAVPRSPEKSAN